ncbi:MAG: SemiSWEET family transporter [Bacteroidota bacterium]
METLANLVGYTAAVVGTFLMLPQVVKSWRTKRVEDLSLGMTILYFLNCLLWLIYGLLITAVPMIVANSTGLVISIIQVALKLKYRQKAV